MDSDPSDLIGRIQRFMESGNQRLLIVALLGLLGLLLLAMFNMRMTLIGLSLLALVFSDAANDTLASGATLARWAIIALIAAVNIWGTTFPGVAILMLCGYGLINVLAAPIASSPLFAVQSGVLLVMTTLGLGSALASRLKAFEDVLLLLKIVLAAAGVWVLVSLGSIHQMVSGARFTGAGVSAPLFAITGGLFLPIALWGSFDADSLGWRWYSRVLGLCILVLLALSGQRTGAVAGVLGCAPMLLRRGMGSIRIVTVIVVLGIVAGGLLIEFFPAQTAFVLSRYEQGGFSGREARWFAALRECLSTPLVPHGPGSAEALMGFGFHNAFLVAWFEGGLVGLILFLGAFVLMVGRAIKLVFRSNRPRVVSVARLSLCMMTVLSLTAFAESKLLSPSNILMTMSVMFAAVLHRLNGCEWPVVDRQWPAVARLTHHLPLTSDH